MPIVIGYEIVPRITDPVIAASAPELAVLSTIAHPEVEVAEAALGALARLPEDLVRLYLDVILAALPEAARRTLEARMKGYQYQSEYARTHYAQGLEQRLEQGLRRAIVDIVGARLPDLRETVTHRLEGLPAATLERLVVALADARDEETVRATIDRVLAEE